ncbi:Ig-like domain-containing protein, partial [Citrobacter freundii]
SSSNSISFTVNTTPLTAPLVTNIEDNVGVITGTLGNGSVTDDLSPTVSGTGTPGSTILIYDNGNLIPLNITVGADGKWSVDAPLSANAQHTLTFSAQDAAGNSLPAANPIVITTDTQAPGAPAVDTIDNNGTLVSGTAEPGSTVIIRNGTTVLGQAVADSNTGAYTVTISPAQTAGESLNAIAQDPAGNQSGET